MIRNRLAALLLTLSAASPSLFAQAAAPGAAPTTSATGPANPAPADAARQSKVDTLLKVSGIAAQLDMLADGMVTELAGPAAQDSKVSDAKLKLEALARKAFPPGRLTQVAREALLKHYDAKAYDHYIAVSGEPLAKRFTEMEAVQIKPDAFTAYLKDLQAHPIADSRVKLIEAIDKASFSSAHRIELITSIAEAMAMASLGSCPTKGQVAQVKDGLAKMKDPITKQNEGVVRITLAYIYRSASDTELEYLLKAVRDGVNQKISRWIWDAVKEEMKSGFAVVAESVRTMAAAAEKQKSVFAQRSCDGKSLLPPPGYAKSTVPTTMQTPSIPVVTEQAKKASEAAQTRSTPPAKEKVATTQSIPSFKESATPAVEREAAPRTVKPVRSRADIDARECLKYEDMKKVMACAEKYR